MTDSGSQTLSRDLQLSLSWPLGSNEPMVPTGTRATFLKLQPRLE